MQVVVRSLNVLRVISGTSRGLTLAEIANELSLPMATVHRILAVLEAEKFIARSVTNRRYFLGPAARELAAPSTARESPLVTAHAAVAEASQLSGETVFLSEFSGDHVVCLALAESVRPLRLFVRVGQTMPLHAAASARVLLAWLEPEVVRRLLGDGTLPAYTSETPTSTAEVFDRLRRIRGRDYDVCNSELDDNVWAVAAPVRASTGAVVASVTLAAPDARVSTERDRKSLTKIARAAAARMSADLGWGDGRITA